MVNIWLIYGSYFKAAAPTSISTLYNSLTELPYCFAHPKQKVFRKRRFRKSSVEKNPSPSTAFQHGPVPCTLGLWGWAPKHPKSITASPTSHC